MATPKQEKIEEPTETRQEAILRLSEGRFGGFASLTEGQKFSLPGFVQPSIIDSSVGEKTIKKAKEKIEPPEPLVTPPTTPEPPEPITPEDQLLQDEINATKTEAERLAEKAKEEADIREAEFIAITDRLKIQLGRSKENQINNIQAQALQLRQKQEAANRRRVRLQETIGVRFGGRFTPTNTADLVQEQIDIGMQKIQELNAREVEAIAKINNAFDEKELSLALAEFEALGKIRDKRDKELSNIEKAQTAGLKELQDEAVTQREIELFAIEKEKEAIESISSVVLSSLGEDDEENARIIAQFAEQYKIDPNKLLNSVIELDREIEEQKAKSDGNLKFIPGTAKQQGGTFNPVTGVFIPRQGGIGGGVVGSASGKITEADLATTTSEEDLTITRVMRLLPTKLKDSERDQIDRRVEILRGIRSGQTVQDIVDEIKGFIITNEKEENLARYLRTLSAGSDIDLRDLSAAINNNLPKKAMTIVENENLKDAEGELSNTVSAKTLIVNANRVLELLKKAPVDNLGAFDGRKFKVEKFFGLSDKETIATQQLETAMVNLLNEIRRKSLGTAVTEAEIKFLQPLLTDLLDQPKLIKTKVEELKVGTLAQHNEARGQTILPYISEDELLNTDLRLQAYREMSDEMSKIRVRLQDGQTGMIDESEFDPNTMEKI